LKALQKILKWIQVIILKEKSVDLQDVTSTYDFSLNDEMSKNHQKDSLENLNTLDDNLDILNNTRENSKREYDEPDEPNEHDHHEEKKMMMMLNLLKRTSQFQQWII